MLQYIAVRCGVLQCNAVGVAVWLRHAAHPSVVQCVTARCGVLQCVAASAAAWTSHVPSASVMQCDAV